MRGRGERHVDLELDLDLTSRMGTTAFYSSALLCIARFAGRMPRCCVREIRRKKSVCFQVLHTQYPPYVDCQVLETQVGVECYWVRKRQMLSKDHRRTWLSRTRYSSGLGCKGLRLLIQSTTAMQHTPVVSANMHLRARSKMSLLAVVSVKSSMVYTVEQALG